MGEGFFKIGGEKFFKFEVEEFINFRPKINKNKDEKKLINLSGRNLEIWEEEFFKFGGEELLKKKRRN